MSKQPLNRTTAPQILRLFDSCFKQGVLDACEARDDYAVREFLIKFKGKCAFGTIPEPEGHDWRSYRFVLYQLARENGSTSLAENYIMMIRKANYLWCLLPYCMWFYMLGTQEWLIYPNPPQIKLFMTNKRIHWDPNRKVKKFSRMDYISYMHQAAFEYKKLDDEEKPVGDMTMDSFCQAVFDLTKDYATRK